MKLVGRFAPSPSGRMHLGNVFTALLAWLSVRNQNGTMLLRVEDLDPARSRPVYVGQLKEDLQWLGLDWDRELPLQSTRSDYYAQQFKKLWQQGLIYPCYCSRDQLHTASAPHGSDGSLRYPGTCRNLTEAQRAAQNRRPSWRIRVPDAEYRFTDSLFGPQAENLQRDCGDFIVRRSDGVYAYQLAVVCDDGQAGVTQIVRGWDLLCSTARQLYLQQLLGYPTPTYCHVPLLTDDQGRRLSKRDADLDMGALRQHMQPEQLLGHLARAAGLVPDSAPISARELVDEFDWRKIPHSPTIPIRPYL